jgi:hypothetical protein
MPRCLGLDSQAERCSTQNNGSSFCNHRKRVAHLVHGSREAYLTQVLHSSLGSLHPRLSRRFTKETKRKQRRTLLSASRRCQHASAVLTYQSDRPLADKTLMARNEEERRASAGQARFGLALWRWP